MRYITGGRLTPREEIERDLLPAFLDHYRRWEGYGFWAAVEKSSGEFLGWFHLRPAPGHPNDEPELGYRLRARAWGRGYATEGARALLGEAFGPLGLDRVVAVARAENTASLNVLRKLGFHHEGERQAWGARQQFFVRRRDRVEAPSDG